MLHFLQRAAAHSLDTVWLLCSDKSAEFSWILRDRRNDGEIKIQTFLEVFAKSLREVKVYSTVNI